MNESSSREGGKDSEMRMISEEHRNIIEGVKLSMDLIESKIPNNSGYAYLVLNKAGNIATELLSISNKKEISLLLER